MIYVLIILNIIIFFVSLNIFVVIFRIIFLFLCFKVVFVIEFVNFVIGIVDFVLVNWLILLYILYFVKIVDNKIRVVIVGFFVFCLLKWK